MNRRGLLKLIGMGAAAPAVNIGTMASVLGVSRGLPVNEPTSSIGVDAGPTETGWWSSPMEIHLEANGRANYEAASGKLYPHMKSWGHAYRVAMREREIIIERTFQENAQRDKKFFETARKKLFGL